MFTPALFLLSAIFVQLDHRPRLRAVGRRAAVPWEAVQAATVVFVVVCALMTFSIGDPDIRGPVRWSEAVDVARARCRSADATSVEVATNPPPFSAFPLPVPCAKLR